MSEDVSAPDPRPTVEVPGGPHVPDLRTLASTAWWLVLLQGVVAIVFGIVAIAFTSSTLLTLLIIFGVYSIVDGILALIGGIRNRNHGWGWLVFQGAAGIIVGVLAIRYPLSSTIALTVLVGFWALMVGFIRIWGAFELRKVGAQGWIWSITAGVIVALFGIVLVINPVWGAAQLIWLIGITAIVFGVALVVNAFLVRRVVEDLADDGILNGSNR